MKVISVSDITIKTTDISPDTVLPFRKKVELAKLLDGIGVSVIETGPIVRHKSDGILVKSLASAVRNATLAVPVNCSDIGGVEVAWNAVREASHPRLQVSLPVSTVQIEYQCHMKAASMLQYARDLVSRCSVLCPEVEFIAEDYSRSDSDFLPSILSAVVEAGAKIVTIRDEAGNLIQDRFLNSVAEVRAILPESVRLGVWCSDEMFLADSCAIASVRAGADEIKTVSYGNAAASLTKFVHILEANGDFTGARSLVESISIKHISDKISMLADDRFCKSLFALQGLPADDEKVRLTSHSDKKTVLDTVSSLGYEVNEDDADRIYETFLRLASRNGTVETKELDAIVSSVAYQPPAVYRLESYVVNTGNTISSTCHLRLRKDDRLIESFVVGDGPVDAAFMSIEKLLDKDYELDDFQIQSVTEGRAAMGEAVVRLRHRGKLYSGRGISTDIVGSSIMAYLNAVNKIEFEEEQD